LYTLDEELEKDFKGTLKKVSEIGYTGVEFAGYGDIPAAEMKSMLEECHLTPIGSHVHLNRLKSGFHEEMEYNKILGTEFIVVPYVVPYGEDDIRDLAADLKALSPRVKDAGFRFGYHNHDREFFRFGKGYLLDLLLELVSKDEIELELDVYWAAFARVDYMSYIRKNAERIKLLHLKQIKDLVFGDCVDYDEGIIDFKEVIEAGLEVGVEHFILEQEDFVASPYVSIRKNFDYIMNL
jgi:sugar phosphate isomerase/epimerase